MPRPSLSDNARTSHPFDWPTRYLYPLLFLAAFLAYWPALTGGLLWDDPGHITRADLRSLDGLARIWFEFGATQQFYPLLHSAFWFEHRLWGDATLGYHVMNVLQHATAACLFAAVLRRLAIPGSTLAALLFVLHPVCVESVAWISEQKNTLSAVLYLGAALAYLRYDVERTGRRYALALLLFVAALLTKSVTATLPAALLVVFWWRRGKLTWRHDVVPLLPWFGLGIASGTVTAFFEHTLIGAEGAAFDLTALERALLAGRVAWFYLGKLLWPAELIFIYPRWTIDAAVWWQWFFPLATLGVLTALVLLAHRVRASALNSQLSALNSSPHARRAPLAAALLFGGTLFPVLGFFNVYPFVFSYVADHFQYLATLPLFALTAAALSLFFARRPRPAALVTSGALLLTLGTLTVLQAGIYRDAETLYRTTLARNPACWMAHNNLAMLLTESGQPATAVPHLEQALKLRPDYPQALSNLGDNLTRLGRPTDAVPPLERALQLQPRYPEAHNNLAIALMALDRAPEAIAHYESALQINRRYATAHHNLGLALAGSDRVAEAIPHFRRAVELQPQHADAELGLAFALASTDRFTESVPHFERALSLRPDSAPAHQAYARSLARQGRLDQALTHFRRVVELTPQSGAAHRDLAFVLRQLGRSEEAQEHFAAANQLGAP